MAFPLSIEGSVLVEIDVSSKSHRVEDGVEKWLLAQEACDVRRVQNRLEFKGNPVYMTAIRRRMENPKASIWRTPGLRGIARGTIEFQSHPDKVVISFAVSIAQFQIWFAMPLLLIGMTLAKISLLLTVVLLLGGVLLFTYVSWRMMRHTFRSGLRIAAIRGLADGAAEELAQLQSRS